MPDQEKFVKKLRAIDELVIKDDLLAFVKQILEFMTSLKTANAETLAMVKRTFDDYMERMKMETDGEMTENKKEVMAKCEKEMNKMLFSHEAMMSEMDKKMSEMEKAMPDEALIAKTASEMAATSVLSQLPPKDDFNEEISKAGDLIVNTLSKQVGEEKLHIEDIYKLPELLEELRELRSQRLGGGGTNYMGISQHFFDDETPTGTVNGVTTDFVLDRVPSPTSSLKVYVNGSRMQITTDYTFSDKTITFLTAPPTGSILLVDYRA